MMQCTSTVQSIVFFGFCLATSFVNDFGVAAQAYPNCTGDISLRGDALCDFPLNNAACGFDGGDCCECTCTDTIENTCGSGGGFFCSDENAPTNCTPTATPTASPTNLPVNTPYPECEGYLPHIQDGYCDADLNVATCDWDGGDCCACTCLEGLTHECGEKGDGFDCQDPDVPPDCDSANLAQCTGYTYYYQDGICDDDLNNAACMWDGGDCCRCTCRDYAYDNDYSWGGYYSASGCGSVEYNCLDPDAPTDCDTKAPTPSPAQNTPYPDCEGTIYNIGDGYCDYVNNNEECDWDGGDCCDDGYCLSCYDPDAECVASTPSPAVVSYNSECPYPTGIGDGICDSSNNIAECSWDGGDCCSCTCSSSYYSNCDDTSYNCIDPSADCSSPTGSTDDDSFESQNTPSPTTDGDAQTASTDSIESGFTSVQMIGIFVLTAFSFCCFGGTIIGSLYLLRQKWLGTGKGSTTEPKVVHPRPSAPQASLLVPPFPASSARESEGTRAKTLSEGESLDHLHSRGSGQPDDVRAGRPDAGEIKSTES